MAEYEFTYMVPVRRRMHAETVEEVRDAAMGAVSRAGAGAVLLSVYRADLIPPPEPGPFGGKPPTGPTPGTPTLDMFEQTEAIAKAA